MVAGGSRIVLSKEYFGMKRKALVMAAALLLMLGTAMVLNGQDAQAAKKKVKAAVRGSTLTISGEGAMPSDLTVKKSKINKVKKIVVRKGITSIPVNAFTKYKNATSATVAASVKKIGQNAFNCEGLEKLTVPGNFTITSLKGRKAGYWISDKVNTVIFNTDLNIERAAAFDASNLVVQNSDPKYKSVKGIIYSKDGKAIIRVPFQRDEVVLEDGCEMFCLQSVLYCNVNAYGEPSGGCQVRKIIVPPSVKKVESDRYYALADGGLRYSRKKINGGTKDLQVIVKSSQLDDDSLSELIYILNVDMDALMKQLPAQISKRDDMYVTNTHVLLAYAGKDTEIKIPAGIKKIGGYVFDNYRNIVKLVLPEGLEEIGNASFRRCSAGTSETDYQYIKKLVLPDSLTKIGKSAFEDNGIRDIQFGKGIKEIGDEAFEGNDLKKLTVPVTVTKVGKGAFCALDDTDVVIRGSSAGFSDPTFRGARSLIFAKGPREQKVTLYDPEWQYVSKKEMEIYLSWTIVKGAEGYEIVTATNAKFTKNKKKGTVKNGAVDIKTVTMKGKFKKNMKIYIKVRPYSYLAGKKIYGRWSQTVATYSDRLAV